jgi:hypothetical protein
MFVENQVELYLPTASACFAAGSGHVEALSLPGGEVQIMGRHPQ